MQTQKLLRIKITQSGTSDPTIEIITNDTGITFTPARTGIGTYKLTTDREFIDMFSMNDASLFISGTSGGLCTLGVTFGSTTEIDISSTDNTTSSAADSLLNNTPLEIWVKVNGIDTHNVNSLSSEPTIDDIPDGQFAVTYNTATGYGKIWMNIGGELAQDIFSFPAPPDTSAIVGGRPKHLV